MFVGKRERERGSMEGGGGEEERKRERVREPEKVRRRREKGEWGREKRGGGRLGGCRTGALSIFSVSPGPAVGLSCYGEKTLGAELTATLYGNARTQHCQTWGRRRT